MQAAIPAWRDAGAEARAAVCIEILSRLNAPSVRDRPRRDAHHRPGLRDGLSGGRSERAGPRARGGRVRLPGLNAHPDRALWEKPGKGEPVRTGQEVGTAPRGIALVVGCNTFPTWNGYPGLFASLVTGNAVVVKPHPHAIAPLALTVARPPAGAGRGGLLPDLATLAPRPRARAWPRSSRCAPRSDHRLHRLERVRRLARANVRAGAGLHREGRDQHDRRGLLPGRGVQGGARPPGVLALALHRADVHRAAEHPGAARRDPGRRGAQVPRGVRRGPRRRDRRVCSATAHAPARSSAPWSTRSSWSGSRGPRAWARPCWPRGR